MASGRLALDSHLTLSRFTFEGFDPLSKTCSSNGIAVYHNLHDFPRLFLAVRTNLHAPTSFTLSSPLSLYLCILSACAKAADCSIVNFSIGLPSLPTLKFHIFPSRIRLFSHPQRQLANPTYCAVLKI